MRKWILPAAVIIVVAAGVGEKVTRGQQLAALVSATLKEKPAVGTLKLEGADPAVTPGQAGGRSGMNMGSIFIDPLIEPLKTRSAEQAVVSPPQHHRRAAIPPVFGVLTPCPSPL